VVCINVQFEKRFPKHSERNIDSETICALENNFLNMVKGKKKGNLGGLGETGKNWKILTCGMSCGPWLAICCGNERINMCMLQILQAQSALGV
jgi:hypothetical protein